jgi:drug/metabolite transporter (DMT)-like permease
MPAFPHGDRTRTVLLALVAFAANSVLCRVAFARTQIDAASFTALRLAAGAAALWLLAAAGRRPAKRGGDWPSAVALFVYAAAFSYAYLSLPRLQFDAAGAGYAVVSGALASGAGYAVWYAALRGLAATQAATVQLAVPLLAAAGGVWLLDEAVAARLLVAAVAILGGIALVILARPRAG